MAAKKESSVSPEKLALYQKLVSTNPKIQLKGDTVPYTSHNGHMFSNLEKDGSLSLRLPQEAIEDFIKKYKTSLAVSYGVVRKEYVCVPDTLLKRTKELKPYFDISFSYVQKLRPKPTRKQ